MADVTFTIAFQDDGTPVIKNLKREVEGIGPAAQRAGAQASGGLGAIGRSAVAASTQLKEAGNQTNLLSSALSNIGRVGGILGLVASAAALVSLLKGAVTAGVAYNATLEQQRIGIGSIIAATSQIADAQGKNLEGMEKFNAAQAISAELMVKIQEAALRTTATSEQLVDAFQAGVGPLKAAGLSLDQALDATVKIVQASSAIGIPMHQVAQEVRAIAEGSIDTNARLAKTLDITNAQVAKLKEQGKLYEFIVEKTKAFADAGKVTEQSFSGLASSIKDIVQQLLGLATQDFFIGMKESMGDVLEKLTKIRNLMAEEKKSGLEKQIAFISTQLDNLEKRRIGGDTPGITESIIAKIVGSPADIEERIGGARTKLAELQAQLKALSPAAAGAKSALDTYKVSAEGAGKATKGVKDPIQDQIEALKNQEVELKSSARAWIDYQAAQLKSKGASDEQVKQFKATSLAILVEKESIEARSKAEQDAAKKTREAVADAKKAAADRKKFQEELNKADEMGIKMSIELAKIHEQEAEASQKEAEANAVTLAQLNEEIQRMQEEGQIIAAGLGPKAELLALETQIALAQTDRATALDLVAAGEDHLNEENKKAIVMLGEERKKVIEATAAQKAHTKALEDAILTTGDLRDVQHKMLETLLDTGSFKKSLDDLEDFGKELGVRLIEGIAFGKQGLENDVLIPNFSDMFDQNGIVGGILGKSGLNLGSLFGDAFSQGVSGSGGNAGSLFGSGMMEMLGGTGTAASGMAAAGSTAGSTWGSAFVKVGGGILNKFLGGGSGSGASMGGGLLSLGGGILGSWAGGKFADMAGLMDSKEGKMGGMIGGVAGGIAGGIGGAALLGASMGSFAGPIGTAIGAIIGVLLGAFAGDLFKPTTTSGTLIRKGIKDYLKEIKVSFAKEVDSGNYFFEETKKLAEKMHGKDFLAASKEILTSKAGPELAKQLQALGTALTADSAMKLKKDVEQTGTTFGNLLVANLGIDEIPDAIAEIVQKSKLSFEGLTGTLTEVFQKGKIGAEFYKDAISGAVDIFFGDLPDAIHVSEIALRSFTDGVFDLEKFQKDLEQAVERMNIVGSAMGQALADGIESGQSRAEVEASFENLVKSALREQIVTKYVSDIIAKGFAGFDFSKPIDMSSDAMARLKSLVGDSYDDLVLLLKTAGLLPEALEKSVDSADSLLDRIRELRATIQDLVTQRIEIRLQLLDDFVTIGLTTALDAIATRIQSIQDRISALLESAGQGHIGTQPFSELSDTDLTQLIQLQEQLRNAILSRYQEEAAAIQAAAQAQIAAIREEYAAKRASIQAEFAARREALQVEFAAKRASIQAEFEARRTAIQSEFEARRTAIQATIKKLEEQRTATEKLFQAQIEAVQVQIEAEQEHIQALQEQLQIAEQFGQVVASITDIIRSAMLSAQTPLAPQQQLGFLQREESGLRSQLATATGAERARLIQELAQVLQQQLQFVDRNTVNGQQLFTNIITELSALRAAAAKEADKAAGLRSQIAAATVHIELLTERIAAINEKMEEAVKKIDAQIEHQQELLSALSAQEQALLTTLSTQEQTALAALSAQEQAALEALSAQEQAQLATLAAQEEAAIHAVEATAAAQLTALRTETAQQLTALAIQQDLLVQEQLRRAEAQLETAKEQLVAQVGAEEAARLLAAGDQAQLIVMTQMNTLLFNIDQHIVDLLNKSSQEETQTQAPSTQQQLSSANSRDTTAAPPLSLNFTFSPVVTMSMQGSEEQQMPSAQLKAGMENTLRLAEQRVKRLIETDWAPTIKRAAEGKI